MKHFGIIALSVALLATSCVKTEVLPASREITFQTASYATKAGITGTTFPTTETFSAYAWADGTIGAYFMDNETISYSGGEWKPSSVYYWPKNTTVDFFCYYPTNMPGIAVDKDVITYTNFDVQATPLDIMYSDKAVGFTDNVDDIEDDAASGYTGVPIIFRHALSKICLNAVLVYNHKEEADGTVTDWEVTLNSARIGGIFQRGNCTLNLASSPSTGLVGWEKPQDANGNYVWSVSDSTTFTTGNYLASALTMSPGVMVNLVPEIFVLPQTLDNHQFVALNMTIKTKRNGVDFLSETFDVVANLYVPELTAWQMNHVITYQLNVSPTTSNGKGGNPGDPTDPSNPVDPSDPDLTDAIITFDPAIDGWDAVDVVAKINI